jgi:hypothetical protein
MLFSDENYRDEMKKCSKKDQKSTPVTGCVDILPVFRQISMA